MADYFTIVTLNMASGVLEDRAVNTFSMQGDNDSPALWHAILESGYRDELVSIYPTTVAQTGHTMKTYNRADPEPRVPVLETTWQFISGTSGTPLPSEVALVLSFQGARISGTPQARRRGRIYLGPLDQANNSSGRPNATIIGHLVDFGVHLLDNTGAPVSGPIWTVWSTVDGANVPITEGWVDNAWDTQRRRGVGVTARTTYLPTP